MKSLLLAIHAMGLGAALTTRWKIKEPEIRPLLGLPEGVEPFTIVPIGWPVYRQVRGKRRPVAEVTLRDRHEERW